MQLGLSVASRSDRSKVSPTATAAVALRDGSDRRWLALGALAVAQFMVFLDETVVNVALPSIKTGLGFSQATLAWVVSAYIVVFGGFVLLGGRVADLFGRRRIFLAGTAVFGLASLLDGLAQTQTMLLGARALQGVGAALATPAALALVTALFPAGPERVKAIGFWGALSGLGFAIGILLGGAITEVASWRWVFLINVPVAVVTLFAVPRLVADSRAGARRGFDVPGALSVTAGTTMLVYVAVKAPDFGWSSFKTIGLFAIGLALLGTFALVESHSGSPLIPTGFLRRRAALVPNLMQALLGISAISTLFLTTLYVQQVLGFTPLQAGLAYIPLAAGVATATAVANKVAPRSGPRPLAMMGLATAALGMALFARAPVGGRYVTDVLPAMALIGLGAGLSFVSITTAALANVDEEAAGLASGLLSTSVQIGGALGVATLASVVTQRTSVLIDSGSAPLAAEVGGLQLAFLIAAAVAFTAALAAGFGLERIVERVPSERAPGWWGAGFATAPSSAALRPDLVRARALVHEFLSDDEVETWHELLASSAMLNRAIDNRLIAEHEMPLADFDALVHVAHAENGQATLFDLADRMQRSPSQADALLASLEGCGFVETRRDSSDPRSVRASATDAGRAQLMKVGPTYLATVRAIVFERLSRRELRRLRGTLARIPAPLPAPIEPVTAPVSDLDVEPAATPNPALSRTLAKLARSSPRSPREREMAMLDARLRALDADIAAARATSDRKLGCPVAAPGSPKPTARIAGERVQLPDGAEVLIRPIEPDDAHDLQLALGRLGALSRYDRFLGRVDHLDRRDLDYLTRVDHRTHEALVAFDAATGSGTGVARYVCNPDDPAEAEFACTVTDLWQGRGVGTALADRLAARARANGVERLTARMFAGNERARRLLSRIADVVDEQRDGGILEITTHLNPTGAPAAAFRDRST